MIKTVTGDDVKMALRRVAAALIANQEHLTELDQAMGDGDLGVTARKISKALQLHADTESAEDIGAYLISAGMASNRAAASTSGTLFATALMRAGKFAKGKSALDASDLATMVRLADEGVQERGKAKLGDKTVLDALRPASEAFSKAVAEGAEVQKAASSMLEAARQGRDSVTSKRSLVGRASWVGERTEGLVDPGCELVVIVVEAIVAAA